jgi:hypothetical protein
MASGIHIKEKNRGSFTRAAKAAGRSVQSEAAHVLADPNASTKMKRKANFAKNSRRWRHSGRKSGRR